MGREDKINILLVDDRSENLLALEAILEHEDYNIIKAFSGEEALKYLLKYDFAAILLDVQMPGMDGFSTAKIIKAREKTKNIPILFITANNMDSEHIFTGYAIGAIDYILKPVDPIVLKAKLEGFIEIYKLNKQLKQHADVLTKKTRELEIANSELSKLTSELRVSEALANVISETSIDTLIVIDENGVVLKVNSTVKKMFQYDEGELIGQNILMLFEVSEDSKTYIQNILDTIKNVNNLFAYENINEVMAARRDGTLFPAEIQIGKRYVQDNCLIAFTIRDISKKKRDQELITYMAYHDSLTDLPNRRLFNDQFTLQLNHARQTNQPLALMYLDMDRFKFINDSLGHIIGDRLLQEIAQRLSTCVRAGDFVARVGGDEFNIILPATDREKTLEIAEAILKAFQKPFIIDNYEFFITTCIGVSVFPYDGEDTLVLIRNADAALYHAKEQGKNRFKVYHSGMNLQSYKSFVLQNDLRKAIDQGELGLVYQPRVDIESGIIKGAEALLRWNHPSWGMVSPADFIPLAEETGQIVEIGEWVFKTACKQIYAWNETGYDPIQISVNFSAQQFLQKDLVDRIQQILTETKVSPSLLEIEITESTILGNEATVMKALNQLRKMGMGISIDDFGTGYSSLNYLRRFPANVLKIDRSFIQDILDDSLNSHTFISTIISLAHGLNMSVVAEGVETEEQLAILKEYNCGEAQGYLFSHGISAEEFEKFLTKSEHKGPANPHGLIFLDKNKAAYNPGMTALHSGGKQEEDLSNHILNAALSSSKKLYSISTREMDVFKLLVNGLSNKEISDELYISEHTVKNHITRIFQKMEVSDRLQAMAKVYQTCIEEGGNLLAK